MLGRQPAAGARDGGLDILRGGVDLAVEIELHGDAWWSPANSTSSSTRRRRWWRTRARAASPRRTPSSRDRRRAAGADLNRRVIDARQRRHRQRAKADDAEQQNGERHERRHDRALDEDAGKFMSACLGSASERDGLALCGPATTSHGRRGTASSGRR